MRHIQAIRRAITFAADILALATLIPALAADRDRDPDKVARHGG